MTFGTQGPITGAIVSRLIRSGKALPDFRCAWDARRGAEQLHHIFEQIAMTPEIFNSSGFTRLKQLEHLIRTQQIDQDFFWRNGTASPP